mmetsp:Transcript_30116/g.62555  ORF Transcript_30116/g.62555 Transcript_30116/m.62555 type:complete len:273 (-) Transcript_30116:103-921(-)
MRFLKPHILRKTKELHIVSQTQHGQDRISIPLIGIGNHSTRNAPPMSPLQKGNGIRKSTIGGMTPKSGIHALKHPLVLRIRHIRAKQIKTPLDASPPPLLRRDFRIPETGMRGGSFSIGLVEAAAHVALFLRRDFDAAGAGGIAVVVFDAAEEGDEGAGHVAGDDADSFFGWRGGGGGGAVVAAVFVVVCGGKVKLGDMLERFGSDAFQVRHRREWNLRHGRGRQDSRGEHVLGDERRMAATRRNCDEGADLSTKTTEQEEVNNEVEAIGRW